jgi:O-antigen/teichoic acid export membrane protein
VDTFTLPRLFLDAGAEESEVMTLYGIYARGQPLVQMVSMLFSAVAVTLVPAIAQARAMNNANSVQLRSEMSIRITWIFGSAASVGLAILAVPINWMMYENGQGSSAIMILSFSVVFSLLNIISASVLQGMGLVKIPALNMLVASGIKIGLNFLLTPWLGIDGAALAAVIAFAAAAILNVCAIMKVTETKLHLSAYLIKSIAALLVMTVAVLAWSYGLTVLLEGIIASMRGMYTIVALTGVLVGAIVYSITIMKLKIVGETELQVFPGMAKKLLPILRKLKMI